MIRTYIQRKYVMKLLQKNMNKYNTLVGGIKNPIPSL